jgi:hypothetical protein
VARLIERALQARWSIAAFAVGVVAAGGVALAAIPDGNGVINGCYATKGGDLRVIDLAKGQTCKAGEVGLNWNLRGPTGPQGPQGLAGGQGQKGDKGEPGLSGVEQVTASVDLGDPDNGKAATATCPTGKRVISGGYTIIGQAPAHVAVDENLPTADGTGWHAYLRNEYVEDGTGWGLAVTAVCALAQ